MPDEPVDVTLESPEDEPAGGPSNGSNEKVATKKRRRRRLIRWGALFVAAGLAAAVLLPGFSVTQGGYYARYPNLKTRMDNWRHSTHSKMSCVACHIEPGVGPFLVFAVKAIPAFYSQAIQGPKHTNLLKAPSRKACQQCHTTYRTVAPSGDLLIPHRAHVVVLGMECVTCHKDLVHSPNRRGFNRPEMETCISLCHDGDKATNKCTECHTEKEVPKSHARKDWLQVHGTESKSQDCGQCHDWTPEYCQDCHSRKPAGHAGNWKTGHGAVAKVRSTGCGVCHEEKFCKECH